MCLGFECLVILGLDSLLICVTFLFPSLWEAITFILVNRNLFRRLLILLFKKKKIILFLYIIIEYHIKSWIYLITKALICRLLILLF